MIFSCFDEALMVNPIGRIWGVNFVDIILIKILPSNISEGFLSIQHVVPTWVAPGCKWSQAGGSKNMPTVSWWFELIIGRICLRRMVEIWTPDPFLSWYEHPLDFHNCGLVWKRINSPNATLHHTWKQRLHRQRTRRHDGRAARELCRATRQRRGRPGLGQDQVARGASKREGCRGQVGFTRWLPPPPRHRMG